MSDQPSAELAALMREDNAAPPPADQLEKLRKGVAHVRDLEREKADVEARLKEINKDLNDQYFRVLPDLLDQAQVPSITIEAEGNMPRIEAKAKPYYHGNIAADWDEEKKAAAFGWLDKEGHGGLIKTEVVITFAREKRKEALTFAQEVRKQGFAVSVQQAVHWATLTSWLKEMIEKHNIMPPLETLGCTVGRVVKLTEKSE